jgi:hypothetical protein
VPGYKTAPVVCSSMVETVDGPQGIRPSESEPAADPGRVGQDRAWSFGDTDLARITPDQFFVQSHGTHDVGNSRGVPTATLGGADALGI